MIKECKEPYCKDSTYNTWTGVTTYVKSLSKHSEDMDIVGLKAVWVKLNHNNYKPLLGRVYHGPSSPLYTLTLIE